MSMLFENLPDVNFAEKDIKVIEQEIISRFEQKLGRKLHRADPWRQTLLTFAYIFAQQRNNIDFAAKQNLLKYSSEGFLQNLGALLGVEINESIHAKTILRFRQSTVLPTTTIISKGTRATPGNGLYFATEETAEIKPGETEIEVSAVCLQAGTIGNGWQPGYINRLVDTFPFNSSVENIEISAGGTDREDLESLRERIRMRPESFSTAGPSGAYEYWAKTANQLIIDVSVKTPSPGVVEVIPLLQGGEIPTQSIIDDVYKTISYDKRRPLTDKVIVRMPEVVKYDITLTFFISRRNASSGVNIEQSVKDAVKEYVLWQKSRLGRNIDPSTLVKMVRRAGGRVDLDSLLPVFKELRHFELGVADDDKISVINGGFEDD